LRLDKSARSEVMKLADTERYINLRFTYLTLLYSSQAVWQSVTLCGMFYVLLAHSVIII
jgi:hypothetical protein